MFLKRKKRNIYIPGGKEFCIYFFQIGKKSRFRDGIKFENPNYGGITFWYSRSVCCLFLLRWWMCNQQNGDPLGYDARKRMHERKLKTWYFRNLVNNCGLKYCPVFECEEPHFRGGVCMDSPTVVSYPFTECAVVVRCWLNLKQKKLATK